MSRLLSASVLLLCCRAFLPPLSGAFHALPAPGLTSNISNSKPGTTGGQISTFRLGTNQACNVSGRGQFIRVDHVISHYIHSVYHERACLGLGLLWEPEKVPLFAGFSKEAHKSRGQRDVLVASTPLEAYGKYGSDIRHPKGHIQ